MQSSVKQTCQLSKVMVFVLHFGIAAHGVIDNQNAVQQMDFVEFAGNLK